MKDETSQTLLERAKELQCVYAVDDVLQSKQLSLLQALEELVGVIPIGFSYPQACRVQIALRDDVFALTDFSQAQPLYTVPIMLESQSVGNITVGYIQSLLPAKGELLSNEIKLLDSIANRVSLLALNSERSLSLLLDMLYCIDPGMLLHIAEKMQNYLHDIVGDKARHLFDDMGLGQLQTMGEVNTPLIIQDNLDSVALGRGIIQGAAAFLPLNTVIQLMTEWIREQRIFALVRTVDSKDASIGDILDAVNKYSDAVVGYERPNGPLERWLIAELSHRFLTRDEKLVNLMLDNLRIEDFKPMLQKIIGSGNSMGNIGGKGAGLFIANLILKHAADPILAEIKTPRTWYLATDQIVDFLHFNSLEELNSYKYKSPIELRASYDRVVSNIKKASLPPQTVNMLRVVLEDFNSVPIIVRSSSLLEDRQSGAFSGKYKSLFLTNQGSREKRLEALIDAVLEVYASMYNPDAIQYRKERGMLNYTEQMGVLIQEVVGRPVGKYYLPAFAGVAFSHNLLRWSTRVTREGGLVRMVMGLGTRAVDRLNDDYPILFSPGQPELQINQTPSDILHYSPKYIDLINMETGNFESVKLRDFLREAGNDFPALNNYVSVYCDDFIQEKSAFALNPQQDEMVVTFKSMLASTDMPQKIKRMLDLLSENFGSHVDIEFASDGQDIYLLQCRPQNFALQSGPAPIPKDLKFPDIVFTANRFVSNGLLENITYIVYVDGEAYNNLSTREELLAVGKAVGMLNASLPRRKFILIGPGRWGSRGDMKLGVRVTYSDISGTAALIEVAKEKHSYTPELSFGTHFFQDLVEAGIVYLPLYPDQEGIVFKESMFSSTKNVLGQILPQYAYLSDVVRVSNIPASYDGRSLSLHMNAELEQAVAFLRSSQDAPSKHDDDITWESSDDTQPHWHWRYYMAEQIAHNMDMDGLGVKGVYLFGSTNTGDAGMGSDIDLILHVNGNEGQMRLLRSWLDGWSQSLARINYLRTGYEQDKLLDIHMVTDADIAANSSYAAKINSPFDPAKALRVKN